MEFSVIAVFRSAGGQEQGGLVLQSPRGDSRIETVDPVAAAEKLFAVTDDKPVLIADFPLEAEQHFLALGGYSISLNRLAALTMPRMEDPSLATAGETVGIVGEDAPIKDARELFQALVDILDTLPAASSS